MHPTPRPSAQIIDLAAYRATHRKPVTVRFLLPSWPWGWLMPVVVRWEIG
jgi:hypothetical protein